jgi:glyoxylase-like metal-dependent hydrolase (beta-lactamase superfamily II)
MMPSMPSLRRCIATIVATWISPLLLSAQNTPAPGITKEILGEGIYQFRAPSSMDLWTATNAVVIVNDKDVTVFDSYTRAGTARMVIAEIKKITSKPVRTLINSHWHQDHWSGNEEFIKAYPGIQIIATTQTRDFMKRMGPGYYAASVDRGVVASRAALDTALRTGKQVDGTALTDSARKAMQKDLAETAAFEDEVRALHRVLPTIAYRDTLVLWSGNREFRLISVTGDATASTVLYLPAEQLLVMGDALVAQESGEGPPPWTTTNYSITPWVNSLRGLEALDLKTIIPGQGIPFHDKTYLQLTIKVYDAIIAQVHGALERGVVGVEAVQAAIDVDSLGRQYSKDGKLDPSFKGWVSRLAAKVYQESLDGVAR